MLRTSLLGAVLMLAGCDDPFFLEAQAVAVCQHLPSQRFEVPPEVREQLAQLPQAMRQGIELERTFDFDVSAQLPAELKQAVQARISLTAARLTVVGSTEHLGFIDQAHLKLQPSAASGLEARQFDYVRTEETPREVSWNGEAFELATYLESGNLKYTVSLLGSLPPGDLVVDVDACAQATLKLDSL